MKAKEPLFVFVDPDGSICTSENQEQHTIYSRKHFADRVFQINSDGSCTVIKDRFGPSPLALKGPKSTASAWCVCCIGSKEEHEDACPIGNERKRLLERLVALRTKLIHAADARRAEQCMHDARDYAREARGVEHAINAIKEGD